MEVSQEAYDAAYKADPLNAILAKLVERFGNFSLDFIEANVSFSLIILVFIMIFLAYALGRKHGKESAEEDVKAAEESKDAYLKHGNTWKNRALKAEATIKVCKELRQKAKSNATD